MRKPLTGGQAFPQKFQVGTDKRARRHHMQTSLHLQNDPSEGAKNLLVNCAGCRPGDRLLIAFEPDSYGYFEADVLGIFREEAKALGLQVSSVDVGFEEVRTALPDPLEDKIADYDVVLFLSRLGDQLRFSALPAGPKYVVCFALNGQMLGSCFGRVDYDALRQVKHDVDEAIVGARHIVVRCPAGTHVEGAVQDRTTKPTDTTSLRFPLSVFSPVMADSFSGRVALGGFLTGTGSRYYQDYTVEFEGQVFALLEAGRLTGFEGTASDVAKADAHYDRVASAFDLDRNFVHSWHAGIHPGCGFPWRLRDHFERWSGSAFGNPRVLHFHTCGAYAPGEISWNVFDPTIEIDGVRLWDNGALHPERLPRGRELLRAYPDLVPLFENPDREVGLEDAL